MENLTVQAPILTSGEKRFCEAILSKDAALRAFLNGNKLANPMETTEWLTYLTGIKIALGNLNNDLSFLATLLVKAYLHRRFGVTSFDASEKPQGAPGIDIECQTSDGKRIVGELKTTKPYQPGFGAAQRTSILKDLARLVSTPADYRFMFVVDPDAFLTLCSKNFSTKVAGIEIIDLVTGKTFVCAIRA
jgi:hypothetical protein